MNIARKVEKFMRDNNLVQYYDLEASHQYEIKVDCQHFFRQFL